MPNPLDLFAAPFPGLTVLESPASWFHFTVAFLAAAAGCGRMFFPLYSAYQAAAAAAKAAFVPAYTAADLSWDLFGDIVEYVAGVGAAWLAGKARDEPRSPLVARVCRPRLLAAVLAATVLFWAAVFAAGWVPPVLRG